MSSAAELNQPFPFNQEIEMVSTSPNMTQLAASDVPEGGRAVMASSGKGGRIPALDFTKGALILIMVLYHWLNYFVGPHGSFYEYLRFLPPSFIFITGFLISQVYLSKYEIMGSRLPQRLLIRGLKLLVIFISLNVVIRLLIPESSQGKPFFESYPVSTLAAIFVTGNFENGRSAAFYVLLPISYLLMLSAALLVASRFYRGIFHVVGVLSLLSILVLNLNGLKSSNLELLTIGLLGVSIGYIPIHKINSLLRHPYSIAGAYLAYTVAITVWNAGYLLQVVGVCLTLLLIYLLGTVSGESGRVQGSIMLLGKYSLVGYIAQIAILQVMRRGLRYTDQPAWALGVSFLVAAAFTMLTVRAVDRARAKAPIVNSLYAAVFS
jgi:peptidoglycan/LPS O-acetylase OafA/YrhL